MSLLSPFARAKRWTNTDNFKMSVHVTVKSVSLHNALDASASYLAIAIARGQKRFKTLKAVWSSGEAVWNQTLPLTCTLFQDKNTGEFQPKVYKITAEEPRLSLDEILAAHHATTTAAHLSQLTDEALEEFAALEAIYPCGQSPNQ